jgi:uncharacterized protein YkwD
VNYFYNFYQKGPRKGRAVFLATLIFMSVAVSVTGQTPSVARLVSASHQVGGQARLIASASAAPLTGTAPAVDGTSLERSVYEMINATRIAHGAAPVAWDPELYRMAKEHSEDMARRGYFSHETPDGLDLVKRARQNGVGGWRAIGENIGYNLGYTDPGAVVVDGWWRSSKHRANLMYARFTHTGLGVAFAPDGRIFFTQVFAER